MERINIYVEDLTPRVEFVCQLIFDNLLGVEAKLLPEPTIGQEIHIIYGASKIMEEYLIVPNGLLSEKGIKPWNIEMFQWKQLPAFFKVNNSDIEFDLFSAVFYLVSRYEEYLSHSVDKHNRFAPEQSLAYKEGFLKIPLINKWVEAFKELLLEKFPNLKLKEKSFKYINTVDVDNAYAFLEKGIVRTAGAYARSVIQFNTKDLRDRTKALLGRIKDPYDCFEYVIDQQKEKGFETIFFWLVADYDVNDKNVPFTSRRFRSLIKSVNDYAATGIHPSYASNSNPDKIKVELKRLSDSIHMPITKSRQHFLKFKMPDTYRLLIENGIEEDYSMGYPSELGFRASICTPFYFYDIRMERKTDLKVYPFYIMEATLKYYKNIGPNKAMENFIPIIEEVKGVNGTLVSLWHNDSISDYGEWKGWKEVYAEMIDYVMR